MDWEAFANMTKKYPGTRKKLAQDTGISYGIIDKGIKEKRLRIKEFEKICKVLKIDPCYFLDQHSSKSRQ